MWFLCLKISVGGLLRKQLLLHWIFVALVHHKRRVRSKLFVRSVSKQQE